LPVHDTIVRKAIEAAGGYVLATGGDSFAAAFGRASDAVVAALGAQAELEAADRLADAGETVEVRDRHLDHFHTLATAQARSGTAELRLGSVYDQSAATSAQPSSGRRPLAGGRLRAS
jgi:class 3 adenylate cyclase